MDKYEENCEKNLAELLKKQDEKIKSVQEGISSEMDRLYNDDFNLNSLQSHDDNEIIYMTNIIEDQRSHLCQNYKPQIEFHDISITL